MGIFIFFLLLTAFEYCRRANIFGEDFFVGRETGSSSLDDINVGDDEGGLSFIERPKVQDLNHGTNCSEIPFTTHSADADASNSYTIDSPNSKVSVSVFHEDNIFKYKVSFNGLEVVKTSELGIDRQGLYNSLRFDQDIDNSQRVLVRSCNEIWQTIWGEDLDIENKFQEMVLRLESSRAPNYDMNIRFKAYDDGFGFRYEFPNPLQAEFEIRDTDEKTQFNFAYDFHAWAVSYSANPACLANTKFRMAKRISWNDRSSGDSPNCNVSETFVGDDMTTSAFRGGLMRPNWKVYTPLILRSANNYRDDKRLYIALHEADNTSYAQFGVEYMNSKNFNIYFLAGNHSIVAPGSFTGEEFNPQSEQYVHAPSQTSWRFMIFAEEESALVDSRLSLNLSRPLHSSFRVPEDSPESLNPDEWLVPIKYTGIWWEQHNCGEIFDPNPNSDYIKVTRQAGGNTAKCFWERGSRKYPDVPVRGYYVPNIGRNGLRSPTTERAKRYMDFSSENNIQGVLVEGWNFEWESQWVEEAAGWYTSDGGTNGGECEPHQTSHQGNPCYGGFDLNEIVRYGYQKDPPVFFMAHADNAGKVEKWRNTYREVFRNLENRGVHYVKTGNIKTHEDVHFTQSKVQLFRTTTIEAARRKVNINSHEPVKDTGTRRTWPNFMTREAVGGNEQNARAAGDGTPGDGLKPEHNVNIYFVRVLMGPVDYTPGSLELTQVGTGVNTTLVAQLAFFIIYYSPIQMACDILEHYQRQKYADAVLFLNLASVDWERSITLSGEMESHVIVARKDRARVDTWFVAGFNSHQSLDAQENDPAFRENASEYAVSFSFLDPDSVYEAIFWRDGDTTNGCTENAGVWSCDTSNPDFTDYNTNKESYHLEHFNQIDNSTSMNFSLRYGGGFAGIVHCSENCSSRIQKQEEAEAEE